MSEFFVTNISSIIVAVILIILVIIAVRKLIKDRKAGKGSCGGNCAECLSAGECGKSTRPHSQNRE